MTSTPAAPSNEVAVSGIIYDLNSILQLYKAKLEELNNFELPPAQLETVAARAVANISVNQRTNIIERISAACLHDSDLLDRIEEAANARSERNTAREMAVAFGTAIRNHMTSSEGREQLQECLQEAIKDEAREIAANYETQLHSLKAAFRMALQALPDTSGQLQSELRNAALEHARESIGELDTQTLIRSEINDAIASPDVAAAIKAIVQSAITQAQANPSA